MITAPPENQQADFSPAAPPQNTLLVILILALGSFAIGTSEFAAMGLLPWYAADLGVDEAKAGYVVSSYAFGVVVGAPITTILGARLPRRRYLAALMAAYGFLNLLAAILPGFSNLVWTRFAAGLPHGGYLGVAMLMAADMMPKGMKAKGVTQVMLGLTVANIIGVPLASALGQMFDWRAGFALPGVLALICAAMIYKFAPHQGVDPNARPLAELRGLANPLVLLTLLVGVVGSGGLFAVYAYLSAALLATTDAPAWVVPALMSAFGVGATLGSIFAGRLTIQLGVFKAVLVLSLMGVAAQGFASYAVGSWPLMLLSAFAVGLPSIFIPLQTRLMEVAGNAQSMAAAMNHAAFNAANGLGPLFAGMALSAGYGWRSSGIVGVMFSLVGIMALFVMIWHQKRYKA